MKLRNNKAILLGAAIVICVVAAIVGGNVLVGSKSVTKEDTEVTTEYYAGSGNLFRSNSFTENVLSDRMSDVSISLGSASIDYPTVDLSNVPVVTANEVTEEAVEATGEVKPDLGEWNNKVMANVSENANIRVAADPEAELVGHLPQGAAADIIERGAEWTQISSGTVVGYVKNEYLAFDEEAKRLADERGKKATVNTETLRIRTAPDENSEVITLASAGDAYGVIGEEVGWIAVSIKETTGYMASEFVTVSYNVGTATSIAEEKAIAEKKAAEEKAEAEKKAKAEQKAAEESKNVEIETTQRDSTPASVDDVTLLGALVQVEAGGQSYECQLAVASTIINRVNSPRFPDTISGVIYQSGQYPPAHNGKVARVLANGVRSSCLEVAREAINGKNNIGSYVQFNTSSAVSKSRLSEYTIIDGECFY